MGINSMLQTDSYYLNGCIKALLLRRKNDYFGACFGSHFGRLLRRPQQKRCNKKIFCFYCSAAIEKWRFFLLLQRPGRNRRRVPQLKRFYTVPYLKPPTYYRASLLRTYFYLYLVIFSPYWSVLYDNNLLLRPKFISRLIQRDSRPQRQPLHNLYFRNYPQRQIVLLLILFFFQPIQHAA